ncbi:bifunctional oligoribonuclease/PAP phosphatase NrnA [bacterium]|nr:bifunctional oligoribonuclease/PAP phosphatase NrnA [bacterium]
MSAFYPENENQWTAIATAIHDSDRIFLSTHVNPDGDAVGSVMAFAVFLKGMGKKIRIINESSTPDLYRFLDPHGIIESYGLTRLPENSPVKGDLVVVLDLGNYARLGHIREFLIDNDAIKAVIDHHQPEQIEADILALNTRACSTGSLVYDLLCHIDRSIINKQIAEALITAIVSDTGFFRYSNTTATTHRIASELYEYNINVPNIRRHMESGQLFCRQKLLGLTLSEIRITPCRRIVYSVITREMFEQAGASREHTEGIIEQLRIIRDIKIAFLVIQEGTDLFKASFRTADSIPANEIASLLGGGGHPKAAGASMNGTLDAVVTRVLDASASVLNKRDS